MAQTTSDILVERLVDWGVDTVFGIPGDGINGLDEAFRSKRNRPHASDTFAPGIRVPTDADLRRAVEVLTFEPPMPGKISLDQAAMFARSLARGEPNRAQIALTAVSNKVRELV